MRGNIKITMDGGVNRIRTVETPRERFHTNCHKVAPRLAETIPEAEKWLRWLDNFYATRFYNANARYQDAVRALGEIEKSTIRSGLGALINKSPLPLSEGDALRMRGYEEQKSKYASTMSQVSNNWDILTTKVNKLVQIDDTDTKELITKQLLEEIADLIVANNRPRGEQWSRPFDDILKKHPDMVVKTGRSGYLGMNALKEGIQEPLTLLMHSNNAKLIGKHPLLNPATEGSYTRDQLQLVAATIKAFPGKASPVPEQAWSKMDS